MEGKKYSYRERQELDDMYFGDYGHCDCFEGLSTRYPSTGLAY